ncbi:MAG: hypothetical protein COB29_01155 [Sulfitobacter sp.]|nr:MAG: hypothetical protein COB29_01155 [Sulfitobacter sp.]
MSAAELATDPEFTDGAGATVHVGDKVSVEFTDEGNPTYEGEVTSIDTSEGSFDVLYDADGKTCTHSIEVDGLSTLALRVVQEQKRPKLVPFAIDIGLKPGLHKQEVVMRAVTLALRAGSVKSGTPHPSVQQYLTNDGDIDPAILNGTRKLPPMAELPKYTRTSAPSDSDTIAQAFASPEAMYWLHAILREWLGHTQPERRPPTFVYTDELPDGRQLFAKWVLTRKWEGDVLAKFKARMVVAAWGLFQGIDYQESYTGSAPPDDLRGLECLAVELSLSVYEMDQTQAYCWVKMPPQPNGKKVIVTPAKGTRMFDAKGKVISLELWMALYGHPASGFALARENHDRILNRNLKQGAIPCPMPFVQSWSQPVMFKTEYPEGHEYHGEIFWLWMHNDNVRTYTSCDAMQEEFREWWGTIYEITGGEVSLQKQVPRACLGMLIEYSDGKVRLSMEAFIKKMLADVDMTNCNSTDTPFPVGVDLSSQDCPTTATDQRAVIDKVNEMYRKHFASYDDVRNFYRSLVSTVGWVVKQVGPSIALAHSLLCRMMHGPSVAAFKALKHTYRFMAGHIDMDIVYVKTKEWDWRNGEFPVFQASSDASLADDKTDRKSQGGWTCGFENQAVTGWASGKSARIAHSTLQSESYWASQCGRQIEYKCNVHMFLGVLKLGHKPIELRCDNQATVLAAGAPIRKFSPRSKQFDIEEKYIIQLVEEGKVSVIHVPGSITTDDPRPGDGFCADMMTKPLVSKMIDCYYAELHGPIERRHSSRGE